MQNLNSIPISSTDLLLTESLIETLEINMKVLMLLDRNICYIYIKKKKYFEKCFKLESLSFISAD